MTSTDLYEEKDVLQYEPTSMLSTLSDEEMSASTYACQRPKKAGK